MNIHQMQISYSSQEDRLIMGINSKNNEEMRLFLTRRIVVSFWNILKQTIDHSLTRQPVLNDKPQPTPVKSSTKLEKQSAHQKMQQQIQHQNIINNSDYDTPFTAGNKFPIGETPILVEKITINAYENDNITLIFTNAAKKEVNLSLNLQLLHNISDLLIKVMPNTGWGIELSDKSNLLILEEGNRSILH